MNTQTQDRNSAFVKHRKAKQAELSGLEPLTIYFAGDLFNHKDLIGNAILARYIDKCSKGRYRCVLPQNLEQPSNRATMIRNQDLKQVLTCDMCLFNFDGVELDSGTVVEFMYAKQLDIPSVVLRTDFRSISDSAGKDPWNLMVTAWPRATVLKLHGMMEYQQAARSSGSLAQATRKLYTKTAKAVIECLDAVRCERPLIAPNLLEPVYKWALACPGGGFAELVSEQELAGILSAKKAKGLL